MYVWRANFLLSLVCSKYRNEVIKRKIVFTLFNEKQIEKSEQCMLKISSFIVDGDQARKKEFPHMVRKKHIPYPKIL